MAEIYEVEMPNGEVYEIEVPDGMDPAAVVQEVEQMFGQQQAPAEQPGMLGQIEQAASQYFPPYGVVKGMFGEGQTGGGMENYGRGVVSGLGSALRGVRQGWNALTGDDAELAQLNQQEAAARQQLQQDTGGGFMSGAGRMVGQAAPAVLAGAAVPAVASASLPGAMAAGAAGGALGGASTALTPEEQARGERSGNAIGGAVLGGAMPLASRGISKIADALRRVAPEEAIDDFATRALGAERGQSYGAFEGVRNKAATEGAAREARGGQIYRAIEDMAEEAPPVTMRNTAALGEGQLDLPDTLREKLNPAFRRALLGAREGSTKVSPIVDASGKPIKEARDVSFKDVREAIREIRKAERGIYGTGDRALQQKDNLKLVENTLMKDLDDWAASSPKTNEIWNLSKRADTAYRTEVAPFKDDEQAIGALLRGKGDEKAVESMLLRRNTGQNVNEFVEQVPGARENLRELYGHGLRAASVKGDSTVRVALEGGTTGEKLLTAPERQFLEEVSESVARGGSAHGSTLSPTLESILRASGFRKLHTTLTGTHKYGRTPPKAKNALSDFLRAYGAGQALEDDQ